VLPDTGVTALKAGQIAAVHLSAPLIKGVIGCGAHAIQFASLATLDTSRVFGATGNSRPLVRLVPCRTGVILVLFTVTLVAHVNTPFLGELDLGRSRLSLHPDVLVARGSTPPESS
jgi:hypothetical protein